MKKHPIWEYLKQNDMTHMNESDFIMAYADPQKAKKIWSYLKENDMTHLDERGFYDAYFSTNTEYYQGLKKKEPSTQDLSRPQKPSGANSQPVSQPTATNDANRITDASKIRIQLKDEFNKFIKNSRGGVEGWDENTQNSNFELATQNKDQIISLANQLEALGYKEIADGFKGAIGNIYNIAGELKGSWVYTAETFDQKAKGNIDWFDGNMDWLNNTILQDSGVNTSPEAKVDLTSKGQKRTDNYYEQMMIKEKEDAARLQEELRAKPDAILISAGPIARMQEAETRTNAAIASGDADVKPYRWIFETNDSYSKKLAQHEEDLKKKKDVYFKDWDVYEREEKTLGDQQRLDDSYSILNDNLIKTGFASPETYVDDNGNTIVKDVKIDWNKLPNDERFQLLFPDISLEDKKMYENRAMSPEMYARRGNNKYTEFENKVKNAVLKQVQDYHAQNTMAVKSSDLVVQKLIDDNFNEDKFRAYLKKQEGTGTTILDIDRINKSVDEIASHYNLPLDGSVRRKLYHQAESRMRSLMLKDDADAFMELNNPELMQRLRDEKNKSPEAFQTTEEYLKVISEFKANSLAMANMYNSMAQEELDMLSNDFKSRMENVNNKYVPQMDELKQTMINLQSARQANRVSEIDYGSQMIQLEKAYTDLYNQYTAEFPSQEEFLKAQNMTMNAFSVKSQKEYDMMMDGLNKQIDQLFEKYTTLDPTLKAELEAAMNSAYNDAASLSQSEMVRRFSFNENTNWAHSTLWTYLKGGFSNFLKGVGEYYQSDAMTRWGQFMAEEATRPAPKIESFTDLLDFDNFTALLGEAGGTTIPTLAVSAGITIASEGVGAPAALTFLTTTLAGTALGIAQQAGSVQYDAYERTGSVSEALKAADEATKAEMEMWWLHMTDALPFMKGFGGLVKTPRYVNLITKPAIELASETVEETLQSNYELNISEGRNRWDNRVVWEKEPGQEGNVVSIKENLIFSAPMSLIGGVGDLFSKEDLSKEQQDRIKYVSDMTKQIVGGVVDDQQRQYYQGLVDRGEFARAQTTLAGLYMTGQIDLEEFSKVESYVAQAQKIKETADNAKLKGVDRDVYSFFTARSEEAKRMAEKSANDPVMAKVYEMQSKDYAQSAADFLIDRKVPTMYTVEHMDGTRVMMTDSDLRNAMNDDGFMTMVAADKIAVTAYGDGSTKTMELFQEKGKVYDEKVDEIRELPVLEDKRAQYVSSRVGRLVSSEDISRDEAVKLATQEWLQTEDGIRYTNLTDKYDTKNKQGLPSEEQQGQKPIETKPIEGAGTEEAPAGGVVQGAQEEVTTEPQAKTEVAPETKLGPPEDWRERILATKTGLELYNTVKEIANEDAFGDPYIKSVLLSVGGARQGRELLIKKLEDKFSREAAEAAAAVEPQAETEVTPAAEPQIETAPNPELVKKGRSLGLTEAQIKMMPAEDRELIATATSKEDVKPLIEKYSKPKTAPETKTTEVTPQPVEVKTTEIKPQVKPKQEQKIPSSQLEATFPEPLERNDDNINKLIEKKNKYNSLPKSKKSYGANLLNQIKQDARDMDLEVITTGGLNIKLIDKKSGKAVNKKGVNRAANKEFNSKRKIALSMGDTGELGIRGLALSYFVGGGSVREGQSELGKDSKEMKSAKKRGLVSEKAYSIDSIALAIAQELYGDSENAPVDAIDDIIAELQDVLLTYETTADMEYDLVEMYDKAMEAQRDAAEYSSMQQANEALDNFEMSEDDLALYYESLPKLTQDEYEDYYRQNYPEAFEQEAESTDSLGGTEGQAREKQEVDKRSKRREKLSGLFEEAEKNAEMIRQGLSDAGIDVQVVSPEEMDKLQDEKGQKFKEVADGIFFSDEGKIYLRNDKASDPQLGKGLAFHEGIHPIINIIRNTNPKLYKALVDGLNKLAQTNEGVSDAKDWADQYDPESREDEFVTESIARIASGEIDPISIPRDLMQRIIDFLNKISQALFGKSPLTYRSSEKEVQKLASQITDLFNGYGRLSDIVGAENVKNYQRNIGIPGVIVAGQMTKTKKSNNSPINVYSKKNVKKLPVKTLEDVYDEYDGKAVVINSDPTRVGWLTLPSGKKIFMYGGPAYLSILDNVMGDIGFATTQESKISSWKKYVDGLFGNKKGVTLVATQAPTAILSNSYALRYVLDAISQLPESVLKSSTFKNEFFGKDVALLKDAFGEKKYEEFIKKYKKADLSKPEVIDGMIAEMSYTVADDNAPASFKARGAFVANLLGGLADRSTLSTVEGNKGYVSKKPRKYIAKELMDRLGINAEKLIRDIGEPGLVDLYMNEGKWGFAVSGFETDPNMKISDIQNLGVTHPLFNAKFPGKNAFLLDGAYEIDKMFEPVKITGPKGKPYIKRASQMLAGSMYVKGGKKQGEQVFKYKTTKPSGIGVLPTLTPERITKASENLQAKFRRDGIPLSKQEAIDIVEELASWKDWYEGIAQMVQDNFGEYAADYMMFMFGSAVAADSAGTIGTALNNLERLYAQEEIKGLPIMKRNIYEILSGLPVSSDKISNFIAAGLGDKNAIPVDMHVWSFINSLPETKGPTKKDFDKAKEFVRAVADGLGWDPREVQAAMWAANMLRLGQRPDTYEEYIQKKIDAGLQEQIQGWRDKGYKPVFAVRQAGEKIETIFLQEEKKAEFTPKLEELKRTISKAEPSAKPQRSIPRRRLPSNTEIVNGFYSPIERNLRETKAEKQSANKWLSGGIIGKGDEAVYTGVRQWLESKNPQEQVSKQEILDWMKNNRVEIQEISKSDEPKMSNAEARNVFENQGYDVVTDSNGDTYVEKDEELYDYNDMSPVEQDAFEALTRGNLDTGRQIKTKFPEYQLEGKKKNYKEVLVTLPAKKIEGMPYRIMRDTYLIPALEKVGHKWSEDAMRRMKNYSDQGRIEEFKQDKDYPTAIAAIEALKQGGYESALDKYYAGFAYEKELDQQRKSEFKSTHFDEPNILVHLRMNTRMGTWEVKKGDKFIDGNGNLVVATENTTQSGKVLFLEEVQSDWGQKGKKEGFVGNIKELPSNYKIKKIRTYDSILGDYIFEVIDRGKLIASGDTEAEAKEKALRYLNKKGAPIAPFVTDTNAWTKLALKMALREAVAQGADKIAWTTGEQQNERYDLSKSVSKIEINKKGGNYEVKAYDKGDQVQVTPIKEEMVSEKELEGVVGKEIANKAINEGQTSFEGADLKVGGKGMRGFYDKIVPDVAKSLVKELTGEKVELGTTQLEGVKSTQQSIEITPELRESIQEGMPQFAQGRAGGVSQDTILDAMDAIDQAIESGVDADTAIQENIISQPWYGSLSDAQKAKVDETIESEYGVSPSQIVVANESAKQIEDLYNSKEKGYKNKIQDLLADDEELKYIYNNIPRILGTLEQEGIIKKNINCP